MSLTPAFTSTTVSFDKSMSEVEKLLTRHGVRESRFYHRRPERAPKTPAERAPKTPADRAPETQGAVSYEFVYPGKGIEERRGVRVTVGYQPGVGPKGGQQGTTPEMAARALFWFLKAKFDSIDYGIEVFDVAFMPHLITALGETFAERPLLIADAVARPEALTMLALPAAGRDK